MKYTEAGLIKTIQPDTIYYNWIFDEEDNIRLTPWSIKFKLEIQTNSKPTISNGNDLEWWFNSMFQGKYFSLVENNTVEFFDKVKLLNINEPDIIFVEELSSEYLLKTLYSIIDELLDKNSKLLSIEIV